MFCFTLSFGNRTSFLNFTALLDTISMMAKLYTVADIEVIPELSLSARIDVNVSESSKPMTTVLLDHVILSMAVMNTIPVNLSFGFIDLLFNTTGKADIEFRMEHCSPLAACIHTATNNSPFEVIRKGTYSLLGSLAVGSTPVMEEGATFSLSDDNIFDEAKPIFTSSGLNLDNFIQAFDITVLNIGFANLSQSLVELKSFAPLYREIPMTGKSISDLLTEDAEKTFDDLFDFQEFVSDMQTKHGNRSFSPAEVQVHFWDFIRHNRKVEASGSDNGCENLHGISVILENNTVTVDLCLRLEYARSISISRAGLSNATYPPTHMHVRSSVSVDAQLHFGAKISVSSSNQSISSIEMAPIQVFTKITGTSNVSVMWGLLEVASTIPVDLNGDFVICSIRNCEEDLNAIRISSTLQYSEKANFTLLVDPTGVLQHLQDMPAAVAATISEVPCIDGNQMILRTNGDVLEAVLYWAYDRTTTISPLRKESINVLLQTSTCRDEVLVQNTFSTKGTIYILTGDASDIVTLGINSQRGLDAIAKNIYLDSGSGNDTLVINDSGSFLSKNTVLTKDGAGGLLSTSSSGAHLEMRFFNTENLFMSLSSAPNTLNLLPSSIKTQITAGPDVDTFYVNGTDADLTIDAAGGNDVITIYGLGSKTKTVIYGGIGNDRLLVNGTTLNNSFTENFLSGSYLQWHGGEGNDTANVQLNYKGDFDMDVFGDRSGFNTLLLYCMDKNTTILSRGGFLANIHNTTNRNSSVDRINLKNATLTSIMIDLRSPNNDLFFGDTMAATLVKGGPRSNSK